VSYFAKVLVFLPKILKGKEERTFVVFDELNAFQQNSNEVDVMGEASGPELKISSGNRTKFILGGFLVAAAVIYLIVTSTQAAAQYYLTVDELIAKGDTVKDRDIKLSGAVIGDSISYDMESLTLRFTIANVPADSDEIEAAGGLAEVLHQAVMDPNASRMEVVYIGPMPDLLQHEAQAIVTGRIGKDGVFEADELLLKCPTRYEDEVPSQVVEG
jgi:cytochrome c-type biogenesis protein CcmE